MKRKTNKEEQIKYKENEEEDSKHQAINVLNRVEAGRETEKSIDNVITIQMPVKEGFITPHLKEKIKTHINELQKALKNDEEFFNALMDKILVVGQGIYYQNVFTFIYDRYKKELQLDDTTDHDKRNAGIIFQGELVTMTREIMDLLTGDETIRERILQLSEDEQDDAYQSLHDEVKNEIHHTLGTDYITIIGDL